MTADALTTQLSILVAEDHPTNQIVVKHHLERKGHLVTIAGNGREAVFECTQQRFDLILMDVQMPEMDGIEACRQIRAGNSPNRNIPVYAVTAGVEPLTRRACLDAGMTEVITKPLLFEQLGTILKKEGTVPSVIPSAAAEPETAPNSSEAPSPVDFHTYLDRVDGDTVFAKQLLEGFILQNDRLLAQMSADINEGDLESLRISAHTIKGGAMNLAAADLLNAAAALEHSTELEPAPLRLLLSHLTREHERLRRFVAHFSP